MHLQVVHDGSNLLENASWRKCCTDRGGTEGEESARSEQTLVMFARIHLLK